MENSKLIKKVKLHGSGEYKILIDLNHSKEFIKGRMAVMAYILAYMSLDEGETWIPVLNNKVQLTAVARRLTTIDSEVTQFVRMSLDTDYIVKEKNLIVSLKKKGFVPL